MNIFEDKTKMTEKNDSGVVTAALSEPVAANMAQVPGLCNTDNGVKSARIPSVGKSRSY